MNRPPPPDPIHILQNSSGSVTSLTTLIIDDDEKLVSGSESGSITIWNLNDYRPFKTWQAHQAHIIWLGGMGDDNHLISHGRRDSVKIWNARGDLLVKISVDHEGFCKCDLMSGLLLALPSGKNSVQLLNRTQMTGATTPLSNGRSLNITNDDQVGAVMAVKILSTSEPNLVVTAYEAGFICIWTADATCSTIRNENHIKDMPTCIAHDAQRRRIIIGSASSKLNIFNDDKLELLHQVSLTNPGINCISIRPKFYATAGWDKRLRLFSAKTLKPLVVLQLHESDLNSIVSTAAGFLVCASSDAMISLWDLYNS